MYTTIARTTLALMAIATPLAAQSNGRHGHGAKGTISRVATGDIGSILRGSSRADSRRDRIPRGQLPPRGMCRVWIDGVPPGLQPAVTDCATAERQRLQIPNSRVIYGSDASFPGRGRGRFHDRRSDRTAGDCAVWDVVVVGGREYPVCRDQSGGVFDRNGRRGRDDDDDFDNEEDDDHEEDGNFQRGRQGDHEDDDRFERGRGRNGEHGRRGQGRWPGGGGGGGDQGENDDQG